MGWFGSSKSNDEKSREGTKPSRSSGGSSQRNSRNETSRNSRSSGRQHDHGQKDGGGFHHKRR